MKQYMNWPFKMAITSTSKLPSNWSKFGCNMAYWVTYLVNVYNIPLGLVVNIDQTRVHLVPIARYWTWENKGSKHIQVLGVENKRPIIMVVFLTANGFLLPL
jgi:hypothetical protein